MKGVELRHGDCIAVMGDMADASVDAIVTDPPYHLTTAKKGGCGQKSLNLATPQGRARIGTGFMGMAWDGGDIAQNVAMWAEALRVLKPGGHLLAFSGARTYHRMAVAIEDAGFEVRDQIMWLYGSGFAKATDKKRIPPAWEGWNTALKPAHEPICVARKPMIGTVAANLEAFGTGAFNIEASRIETSDDLNGGAYAGVGGRSISQSLHASGMNAPGAVVGTEFVQPIGRWPANVIHDGSDEVVSSFPMAPGQRADASNEATMRGGQHVYNPMRRGRVGEPSSEAENDGTVGFSMRPGARRLDEGSAARFFYCAKTSSADRHEGLHHPGPQFEKGSTLRDAEALLKKGERGGNHHPTVKPTELMRYLVRLVTPSGGVVLDPFMGSGSTGKAAVLEGFRFIGIDLSAEYLEIARQRIAFAALQGHQPDLLEAA